MQDAEFGKEILAVITDISEIKNAQIIIQEQLKSLEFKNKQFINLYNNTPAMLQSLNKKGEIVNVSDYWLNKMQYSREEVIGKNFAEFLTNDTKYLVEKILTTTFESGRIEDKELTLITNNGFLIEGSLSSIKIVENGVEKSHSVIQDITESARTFELIESQNAQLTNFKKTLDNHLLVTYSDIHGIIFDANERFEDVSGYKRSEIIGKRHDIINSEHHTDSFWEGLWNTILERNYWCGQIKNKKKNGNFYWVDTLILPITNSEDELEYFLEVSSDITLFKEYEEKLEKEVSERTEQIDIAKQEKEFVLAVLSHDLKKSTFGYKSTI